MSAEIIPLRPVPADECRSLMEQWDDIAEAADRRGDTTDAEIANQSARYWERRWHEVRARYVTLTGLEIAHLAVGLTTHSQERSA